MDDNSQLIRAGYVALAAVSGAVTALGFMKWKEMSRGDIALTFIAGFTFAMFVTPWFAHEMLGINESNTRAIAGLTYVFGSGSNILLPALIRLVRRNIGNGEVK